MNASLVSVNITTYNRGHLLPRALDSIQAQTYKLLEVIVVDDCSCDNTVEVVNRYQEQDDRVRYIRHDKNWGNAKARNTALAHCTGYFIAFMDDDDWWIDPDKISKQVRVLNDNPEIGLVCTNVRYYKSPDVYEDKHLTVPNNLKSHILSGNGIIHNSTVLTTKRLMETVGGFDENMPKGVDSEFFRRCIVKDNIKVCFMGDITTAYSGYGDDRMTPVMDCAAAWRTVYAHFYLLRKYFVHYLVNPYALLKRTKSVIKSVIHYIKIKRDE